MRLINNKIFRYILALLLAFNLSGTLAYSDDDIFDADDPFAFDESAMFSDMDETMVDSSTIVNNEIISLENEADKISFSGELQSVSKYSITRDYITDDGDFDENEFDNYVIGNFLLDIRLKNNIKGFANLEIDYYPNGVTESSTIDLGTTELTAETEVNTKYELKEIFVDVNKDKKVYYRIGKQVLQWGRGYLWNPTDLINIDKKTFISDSAAREGVYGLKAHIPQGAEKNYYVFIDTTDAENVDEFGTAVKAEFLVKNTEMAFSAWSKKDYNPVVGYDVSTRVKSVDVIGEISLSDGANQKKLKVENGSLVEYEEDGIIPRITVGLTKSFDYKEENDKITVIGEFFYNHSGYDDNIFDDDTKYATDITVETIQENSSTGALEIASLSPSLTMGQAIIAGGYYEANMLSKYYSAIFTTVNEFMDKDELTLNINLINNLVDGSGIFATGLGYSDINDLSMNLNFNSYFGPEDAEYTTAGLGADIEFVIGISF